MDAVTCFAVSHHVRRSSCIAASHRATDLLIHHDVYPDPLLSLLLQQSVQSPFREEGSGSSQLRSQGYEFCSRSCRSELTWSSGDNHQSRIIML